MSNNDSILDVQGYVPKDTILDTGASKVMINKKFADAMGINAQQLQRGEGCITASGAIERPLGITKEKLAFTMGRGTDTLCVVDLTATVVDTTVSALFRSCICFALIRAHSR